MTDTTSQLPALPCYLNGEFSTVREARVSVLDRGFIFGDGIYEVVPAYAGRPFRFAEHMARLDRSLGEMRMRNPMDRAQWRELVDQLIAGYAKHVGAEAGQETNQLVYIQITRGVAMRDHVMPQDIEPTVFAMANRMGIYTPDARPRRRLRDGGRLPLEEGPHQEHQPGGRRAVAADERRRGRIETIMFRDGCSAKRRPPTSGWSRTAWCSARRRTTWCWKASATACSNSCAAGRHPVRTAPVAARKCWRPTRCCCPRPPRRCCLSRVLDGQPVGNGRPGPIYEKLLCRLPAGQTGPDMTASIPRPPARRPIPARTR
jgi:D-alanine transaminase